MGAPLKRDEVKSRAAIAENILFGEASARSTEVMATAIANLILAIDEAHSDCAIDGGMFVFLRLKDSNGKYQILAKRLTVAERAILDSDPRILLEPTKFLDRISSKGDQPKPIPEKNLKKLRNTKPLKNKPATKQGRSKKKKK